MITRTEGAFLAVGVIAHAAFLVSASRAPAPAYHFSDPETLAYVEIETPEKETPEPPPDEARAIPHNQLAANTFQRSSSRSIDPAERPTTHPHPQRTTDDAPEIDPSADNSTTAEGPKPGEHPSVQFDDPSPDAPFTPGVDRPVWMMPDVMGPIGMAGPPAPTETPKARKVSRDKANEVLGSAIREKDKGLGLQLPAAGVVASSVKTAAWDSLPDEARGTLVVVIGSDGKVQGVKVASQAGGSAADWNAVAANVQAALAARKLNLTEEYAKGAIVTVSLQSKRQLPSGADPSSPVHLGTTSTFDISDIGAKSIRQVTTSVGVTPIK